MVMTWPYQTSLKINSDEVSHAFQSFEYQILSAIKHLHEGRFLSRLLHLITNEDCSYFIIEQNLIYHPGCLLYYEPNQWHTVHLVSDCEQCLRSMPLWHIYKVIDTAIHIEQHIWWVWWLYSFQISWNIRNFTEEIIACKYTLPIS